MILAIIMCLSALSMHNHNDGASTANAENSSLFTKYMQHKAKDFMTVKRLKRGMVTTARQPNSTPTNNEPKCLNVRPSLAELEKMEVQLQGRGIIQQRIFLVASNKVHENCHLKYGLQERILDLVGFCDNLRIYESDRVTGLLLSMPSHTVLVLEAGDDLMHIFTKELNVFAEEYWSEISIFQVEDRVAKVYFDSFVYRHLERTNKNCEQQTKPETSSLDDVALKRQHWRLRQNLHKLCAFIMRHLQTEDQSEHDLLPTKVTEHLQLDATMLEQVLLLKQFYRSLQSYVSLINRVPYHFDEDLYNWEKPKIGFSTKDIFERSPYEVNLSFDVNNPTL